MLTLREGLDLQLQVDERSGQVVAALLAGPEGAVELRVFAAPRNGDIWDDVRKDIAAEVTRRGGTATEADGPWGPELRVMITVTTPNGQHRHPALPGVRHRRSPLAAARHRVRQARRSSQRRTASSSPRCAHVVVRRGGAAHAPGEPLPLPCPPD